MAERAHTVCIMNRSLLMYVFGRQDAGEGCVERCMLRKTSATGHGLSFA